ncbi:hypothetical protein D3C74_417410 [compost metagenome]
MDCANLFRQSKQDRAGHLSVRRIWLVILRVGDGMAVSKPRLIHMREPGKHLHQPDRPVVLLRFKILLRKRPVRRQKHHQLRAFKMLVLFTDLLWECHRQIAHPIGVQHSVWLIRCSFHNVHINMYDV